MNKKLRKKTAQSLLLMVTCSFGSHQSDAADPPSTSTTTSTFTCEKAINDCPKGDKNCFQDKALNGICKSASDPNECAKKTGEDDAQRFKDDACDHSKGPQQQQSDLAKVGAAVSIAVGGVAAVGGALKLGQTAHDMVTKGKRKATPDEDDEGEKENNSPKEQANKRPKIEKDTRGREEPAGPKLTPSNKQPTHSSVHPTTYPMIQHPTSHTSVNAESGEQQQKKNNYTPYKQVSPKTSPHTNQFIEPQKPNEKVK